MKENLKGFAGAWGRYWTEKAVPLALENTPAYPLARTVPMSADHPYEHGAVSFRMTDLALHGLERLAAEHCTQEAAGDRLRLKLTLQDLALRGRYALEVKPDPVLDLDVGGNMLDLPPGATDPIAGGADESSGTPDPQTEEWLDQARDQRSRLMQTENGQKMMILYNQHSETYADVFQKNKALPPLWKANGATKEMAADTSTAVKAGDNAVVNSASKQYSGGVTYNSNAFVQQLNVAAACVWTDPDFDPETGPPPGSKYWEAAKAALAFGKGVSTTTNNAKDQVQEMTPSQIHTTVDQHDQDLPQVSDDEVASVIAQGGGPGGGATAALPNWVTMDQADRNRLRALYEATMRQRAEDAAITGHPLFVGDVTAQIDRFDAVVELVLEEGRPRPLSASIELPAFALDIDDAMWIGEVGQVARRRLESMYFIRSLLHDALVDRLQQSLQEAAAFALNQGDQA